MSDEDGAPTGGFSEVVVVGRLGAKTDVRELPSGDTVTVFTVVVDRPARPRAEGSSRAPTVDAIACQAFRTAVGRRVESLAAGEWVRVEGSLRRRFWRAGSGLGSAMEVEATRVARVRVRP
ncbi:MAG: single-stranded DNA-binding protein [Actinobacteria bacterium]|jgi:single-strand DNA-binding protein|nr:single-stranded DNA-binding protein [Actinomycetota bacterium]